MKNTGAALTHFPKGSNPMDNEQTAVVIDPDKPSFLEVFRCLEDGALEGDITSDMVDLVHNMRALALSTGGKPKAKITLSLEIKLDGGVFEVVPGYKVVPPKRPRSRSIYYATKDGGLSPHNQAQRSLFQDKPKDVTTAARPLAVSR